jgi:asparagine synthase (glutamine-hydrolysing)
LESKGWGLRDQTDAEIVLRAYQCWGEDCAARIIGDFAFVIWDRQNQQLLCARDAAGLKPFYYYSDRQRFLFASELHQILEDHGVARKPNEGMIAEYLAASPSNLRETLYQNIFQLPRAHRLIVKSANLHIASYWTAGDAHQIRYKNDQDYAEDFLGIFQEAVKCRLRSHRMVAAELSGGLDSSSIVSVAQQLRRGNGAGGLIFKRSQCSFQVNLR